jgi:hypothetical protein
LKKVKVLVRKVVILTMLCLFVLGGQGAHKPAFAQQDQETIEQEQRTTFDRDKPWRIKDPNKVKKKKTVSVQTKFKKMARALLGKPHWSERFLSLLDRDIPKIAIHPFEADELPVSLAEAQIYVDGFTRALVREATDRYAVVGRKELGAVVKDINEMGTRTQSQNPLGDLIDRARSDLLAIGTLTLKGQQIILSYKLMETETGRIVSSTQQSFPRKTDDVVKTTGTLSVQGAAQKAARALMRDLSHVRKIMVQGLRYQTSGIHTSFGRYFTGLLVDELRREATSGPRNINSLEISDFVIEEEVFRGLKLANDTLEKAVLLREGSGYYILKGTYWPFEHFVDIRLGLEDDTGAALAWRARILRADIAPELDIIPPAAPIDAEHSAPLGPINLYLSSNKGKDPSFKIGQKMVLSVRTSVDAHIGCYYLQADGAIFRIFPNRFVKSGFINGGFTQHIPAMSMPFAFEFTPPSGVEAVKCFATDRDVSKDIKQKLGQAAFTPLNVANERQLTKVYRTLPRTILSEASLIISIP